MWPIRRLAALATNGDDRANGAVEAVPGLVAALRLVILAPAAGRFTVRSAASACDRAQPQGALEPERAMRPRRPRWREQRLACVCAAHATGMSVCEAESTAHRESCLERASYWENLPELTRRETWSQSASPSLGRRAWMSRDDPLLGRGIARSDSARQSPPLRSTALT